MATTTENTVNGPLLGGKKPSFKGMISQPARKLLKSLSSKGSFSAPPSESSVQGDDERPTLEEFKDEEVVAETPTVVEAGVKQEQQEEVAAEQDVKEEVALADEAPAVPPEVEAVAVPPAAAAAEPVIQVITSNGVHKAESETRSTTWQLYQKARLSKVARSVYVFAVAIVLLSFYVGDLTGSQGWTNMLRGFTVREVPIKETPALIRGGDASTLRVGDFMYSCRPAKEEGAACEPTVFFLRDDGAMVLGRGGTTPASIKEEVWSSKPDSSAKVDGAKKTYTATYNEKGFLTVNDESGKTIWRRRPIFTPRVLRPWPLA